MDHEQLSNQAAALLKSGNLKEAADFYRRAIAIESRRPDYHYQLGLTCQMAGDLDAAIQAYEATECIDPSGRSFHNLALAWKEKKQWGRSLHYGRQNAARFPTSVEAWNLLGLLLQSADQLEEAIAALGRSLAIDPNCLQAHLNLAVVYRSLKWFDEASRHHRASLVIDPDSAEAHWNHAFTLLLQGDFERGWAEWEWRDRLPERKKRNRSESSIPLWKGESLRGKRIVVRAEQGLGDSIQFARFVPLLLAMGAEVIFELQPALHPILATLDASIKLVEPGAHVESDFQTSLLSLPAKFHLRSTELPGPIPYLHETARTDSIPSGSMRRVGMVHCGNPDHENDRRRSMAWEVLLPLFAKSDIQFINLQPASSARLFAMQHRLQNLFDSPIPLTSWTQTAQVIASLDLIISVDTAVAHLAGAMGKPVWILLPFAPDWRWLAEGSKSAWYPTARLFRQPSPGDWSSVVAEVVAAL